MRSVALILMIIFGLNTSVEACELAPKFSYKTKGLSTSFLNKSLGSWVELSWNFGDGNVSKETNPVHRYTEAGTYTFTLTLKAEDKCTKSFSGKVHVFDTSSEMVLAASEENEMNSSKTIQNEVSLSVEAYPNPFNSVSNLEIILSNESMVSTSLFNVSGQLVRSISKEDMLAGKNTIQIERNGLPSGTYIAVVSSVDQTVQKRLIIQ